MPMGGRTNKKVAAESSQRQNRRRQRTVIQTIYDISKDIFATATQDFLPLPSDMARLSGFLNGLTLQDVGLDATIPYLSSAAGEVTYLHFADSPTFSFGVFCLPQSAVIPLHDHPGMTVFSKILLGSMHIKSYDWAAATPPGTRATVASNGARLAKLNTDAAFDASSETVVLYPENGNLHCFTATEPCVVLDVMAPPYCQDEGRDCAYYSAKAARGAGGAIDGQYVWLKQVRRTFHLDTFHLRPSIRK